MFEHCIQLNINIFDSKFRFVLTKLLNQNTQKLILHFSFTSLIKFWSKHLFLKLLKIFYEVLMNVIEWIQSCL